MNNSTPSILLVDDDLHTRQIFELIMNHLKFSNFTVLDDASLAIEHIKMNQTQYVIIDLFMPIIDGFKLLDMIRDIDQERKYRIIATTSYYNNTTEDKVRRRGFDGYLPKPLKLENIVALMEDFSE